MVCFGGALISNNVGPSGKTYVLETLTHQVEQCWTVVLLCIQKSSQNLLLEIGESEREKVLRSKRAWKGAMCPVISLVPFSKLNLLQLGCFMPSLINLSGMPLAPKEVQ